MRDYAKVSPRFWLHGSGKRLRGDTEAQLVALHLLTGPSSTMIGLYYLPLPMLAHETGLSVDNARAAMERVCSSGFAAYDDQSELVWVRNAAEFEFGDGKKLGAKREKGIANQLLRFGGHRFVRDFLFRYGTRYRILVDGVDPESLDGEPADTTATPSEAVSGGIVSSENRASGFGHQGTRVPGYQGYQGSADAAALEGENTHQSRKTIGRTPLDHIAEHAWRSREQKRGLPALELSESDRGHIRAIVIEQEKAHRQNPKVTIEALFDEWHRDEWFGLFGASLAQLRKQLRSVINAVVDSKHRPKLKQDHAAQPQRYEPKVPNYHTGEADRIAAIKWVPPTDEEKAASAKFREEFEAMPDPMAGVL